MKAKALLVACAVGILSASLVMAQEQPGAGAAPGQGQAKDQGQAQPPRAGAGHGNTRSMEALFAQLNLDEKQKEAGTKLNEEARAQIQKIWADWQAKFMEILTPEQKEKFQEILAQRQQRQPGAGRAPEAGAGQEKPKAPEEKTKAPEEKPKAPEEKAK